MISGNRGKNLKVGDILDVDSLSDLPQSIIERILTKLPIRDAIRTSILSRRWRYKWTSLTELVFDDDFYDIFNDRTYEKLSYWITQVLFLHEGPIHKFHLSLTSIPDTSDLDQWMIFLSRKGIKELIIVLSDCEEFRMHSSIFNCSKLTRLYLLRCVLNPPPTFKGFLCLKSLTFHQVEIALKDIESLIANCPLLESLELKYCYLESPVLNICAPNLKYLDLEGDFREIRLQNTPLLVKLLVSLCSNHDNEPFGDISDLNFEKFLGGVPHLEQLSWHMNLTKYLSTGNAASSLSVSCLRDISLYQVNFKDTKEILAVLRLITSSPNLEEFQISGHYKPVVGLEALDLDFWKNECPLNCTFGKLRIVKMREISGVPHEMKFIKYLLKNSPVLESMSITPCFYIRDQQLNMTIELLKLRRVSPQTKILFINK